MASRDSVSKYPVDKAPPAERSLRRRSTLKDVARLAGVSPMTVSNVVNGTLRGYNEETRDRVLDAIERANYRPDIAARSLRTDRRMAVGMLVVQTGRRFLADPYITSLLDGLCAGLNQRGYSLVLQGLHVDDLATASLVQQLQTDGLCVLMSGSFMANTAFRATLKAMRQPIVMFQQPQPDPEGDICSLRQDDFDGGRVVCEHLVQRGARHVVAVVPELDWPAMSARVAGVRSFIDTSGARTKITVLTSTDESAAATQGAIEGFMASNARFDAVFAGNDQMAIAAHRLFTRRQIRIPEDVMLAGFNGLDFIDYFGTRLTTVRSPAFELGQLGAYHMVKRIETGGFDSRAITLPTELMIGTTT
ncbi:MULTISPECIES: LacI family DNA-binding transcriptional regulator [unclassified Chelatococcus]|uniref:LacI family DNA-binding transcriptional regulator n=1 Tax=unclassified Chelatococcus TaxID=2638111 RepID=UPI0024BEAA98|nr:MULTISPECIES: LacI family DNA-binding transcriptional regulator [unclassified Chelatococcus]